MKYYIDELNKAYKEENGKINYTKLNNNLYHETVDKNIILSSTGYYTIYNNNYYKHFIDTEMAVTDKCYYKINNYLDKYTMYVDNNHWIKKKVYNLPIHHNNVEIVEERYKLNEKCNVTFVIEKNKKGEICDIYFLSQLNENDYSFQETMSYLIPKLI